MEAAKKNFNLTSFDYKICEEANIKQAIKNIYIYQTCDNHF